MLAQVEANDLASLKEYFDSGESGIEQYAKAIEYTYHAAPQIFRLEDSGVRQVNPDQSFFSPWGRQRLRQQFCVHDDEHRRLSSHAGGYIAVPKAV